MVGFIVVDFILILVDIFMVGNIYLYEIVVIVIVGMKVLLDVDVLWIFCMVI